MPRRAQVRSPLVTVLKDSKLFAVAKAVCNSVLRPGYHSREELSLALRLDLGAQGKCGQVPGGLVRLCTLAPGEE